MKLVYLCYAVSGFVALGYQVVWFRVFTDEFGSTNLTFTLVVCNFIAGLGAGALASRRVTGLIRRVPRLQHPLRAYGAVEVFVAAAVLLTPLARLIPANLWGTFPYRLEEDVYRLTFAYQATQTAIAMLCVFVPCFFMGVTFPLLCSAFQAHPPFPSSLYAWNTMGACLGILACEFIFLPHLGHGRTLWVIWGLTLFVGLVFLTRGDRVSVDDVMIASSTPGVGGRPTAMPTSFILACAALSGMACGSLEADNFKRLWFLGCFHGAGMSFISFWAIVGIFLASTAVASFGWLKLWHIQAALILAVGCYFATWKLAFPLHDWLQAREVARMTAALSERPPGTWAPRLVWSWQSNLPTLLLYVGLVVLPAYFLSSLLLPYLCNRVQAEKRHLGAAYGLNTLTFCLGMVAFSWIAPRVNIFYSLKLFMIVFTVLAAGLILFRDGRRVAAWKPILMVIGVAAAAVWTPRGFDRTYFHAGTFPATRPLRALKSDGAHTTFVVETPLGDSLFFDGHSMSGTAPSAQRYMRLMAHFPLLAHPRPASALLICFGVGNTASAIAAHPTIERLDVVDLNDKVFETAPEFAAVNERVYADPRVRLIHDDGRSFLSRTDRRYDLITSEPPPPMQQGVYRLYSREYYDSVLARLTPNGLMTQWLPLDQMPAEAVERAVATFVAVFPHTLLFVGADLHYILMGGASPIDLVNVETAFERTDRVVLDMRKIGVAKPIQLLARIVQSDHVLRREYGGSPVVSDQRNDFSYLFMDPGRPAVVRFDSVAVLAELPLDRLECGPRLRETFVNLARLRAAVPDFPAASLMSVSSGGAVDIAFAGVDWDTVGEINAAGVRAQEENRLQECISLFEQSLAMAGDQSNIIARLARARRLAGQLDQVLALWQRYQALEPEEGLGHFGVGLALFNQRRPREALPNLRRAIELEPGNPRPYVTLGNVLASLGKFAEAVASFDQALKLDPSLEEARGPRERAAARQTYPGPATQPATP